MKIKTGENGVLLVFIGTLDDKENTWKLKTEMTVLFYFINFLEKEKE